MYIQTVLKHSVNSKLFPVLENSLSNFITLVQMDHRQGGEHEHTASLYSCHIT